MCFNCERKDPDPICIFCSEELVVAGGVYAANGPICSYCVELADGEPAELEEAG